MLRKKSRTLLFQSLLSDKAMPDYPGQGRQQLIYSWGQNNCYLLYITTKYVFEIFGRCNCSDSHITLGWENDAENMCRGLLVEFRCHVTENAVLALGVRQNEATWLVSPKRQCVNSWCGGFSSRHETPELLKSDYVQQNNQVYCSAIGSRLVLPGVTFGQRSALRCREALRLVTFEEFAMALNPLRFILIKSISLWMLFPTFHTLPLCTTSMEKFSLHQLNKLFDR